MAITLDITGILQSAAFWVSNQGGSSGWRLYFYFYVMLTLLSVMLGNDPVILSGTVFLVYYTAATGLEPLPWLISEFASANTASMVLFVGNPTNVVVCEGFAINNAAFTAYTILPFVACNIFCFLALAFQFRSEKHIRRKMANTRHHLNPRTVLRDPLGALVGSILLGSCLIVAIIVSFFKIDVWMITLPFAGAKLIFDFTWDYYRYGRHQQTETGQHEVATDDDAMLSEIKRAMSIPDDVPVEREATFGSSGPIMNRISSPLEKLSPVHPKAEKPNLPLFPKQQARFKAIHASLSSRFPTFFTALPRLPFALVPFAFSQFILIEALSHQGWIDVFAEWLVKASGREMHATIWLIGVLGVIMCNLSGTNIGATILLTKVVRAASEFPEHSTRAAGIALAVSSNIGAVSFTFSASLAGLLWQGILKQKGIQITQRQFAFWNLLPIFVMTGVGLGVVSAEIEVLYRGRT